MWVVCCHEQSFGVDPNVDVEKVVEEEKEAAVEKVVEKEEQKKKEEEEEKDKYLEIIEIF